MAPPPWRPSSGVSSVGPLAACWVFRRYRATLFKAVTEHDILPLANFVYSRGMISNKSLEHAGMTTLTPSERKIHLFNAIQAGIKSKPQEFLSLLDYLHSEMVFCDHALELWRRYEVWIKLIHFR